MGWRPQRRKMLRRKLLILRALTKSKSVKKSSIIMDAFLYISKLKFQIAAIQREYHFLINHVQEVNVERVERGYLVRVTCKKRQDVLGSILEALDHKKLNVVEARVTCNHFFTMEAILHHHHELDIQAEAEEEEEAMVVEGIVQAIHGAIQSQQS